MNSGIRKLFFLFFTLVIFYTQAFSQSGKRDSDNETLQKSIEILKRYFYQDNNWYITSPTVAKDVRGLVNFIEDEPVDSIIHHLYSSFNDSTNYVFRLPENVEDSLYVPGYYPVSQVRKDIGEIKIQVQTEFQKNKIQIPQTLITEAEKKVKTVPKGQGMQLFKEGLYEMPQRLQIPEVIPDSVLNTPEKFRELVRIDSIRNAYIEEKRLNHNDSVINAYIDSVKNDYVRKKFEEEMDYRLRRFSDSVKINNYNVLKAYNEAVVRSVNDSILLVLETLAEYADFIDSTQISFVNLTGDYSDIMLKNGSENYTRVWLKNVQKDSLSVLVKNIDKRSVYMFIDDGVTISRYKPKETKNFDFKELEKDIASLKKVGNSYNVYTPWVIGGEGHVGFSQIYLENWKKGGQSAVSSLILLKGFANYSRADGLVKWINNGELRNGWIRQGGKDEHLKKNDDRFELTSRFGVNAYKKWFYSAEMNFETQLFRGYNFPREEDAKPISAFMAPAKTFFKLGMEYKPDKDFSMLLSPITVKNVFVRDTSLIDQTKFGVEPNRKSFWEPGLNADIFWKTKITEDITYETKYKMFINYKEPFSKFDVNWSSLLDMKLNSYINLRLLVHLIYDDDVLFPVYDDNEVKVGEKPKLQVMEYFSIGFTYKINHKVMKSERIR